VSDRHRLAHDWLDLSLPDNVVLDDGAWLYSAFAFLHHRSERPVSVRIGARSGVYVGSFFELGPAGEVDIGRYCTLVGAIIRTDGRVTIGDFSYLAHEVVIADGPFPRPPTVGDVAGPGTHGPILGADVWVGMGAAIIGPVTIGDGAIIAARSVVATDVPPYTVVAGNPATVVKQLERPEDSAGAWPIAARGS